MQKQTFIRDPIHGDITLEPHEVEIIDTPDVQRLRELKQLGMAQLIYPSATHTRFEHALGTLHVAEQTIKTIESRRKRKIHHELQTIIRLAALLHDIARLPFGDALELDYQLVPSTHDRPDRLERFLGSSTEVGKLLDKLGYASQIREAIGSTYPPDIRVLEPFARDIVVGPGLSACLLDASARDATQVGIALGYDNQRILDFLDICSDTGRLFLHAADKRKLRLDVLSEVAGLLTNQHRMMEVVHGHRAKRAAEAMLARVFQASGFSENDVLHLGDSGLVERLQSSKCQEARTIMPLLQRRHLYKPVFQVSGTQAEIEWLRERLSQVLRSSPLGRLALEQMLEHDIGLPAGAVIVSCPPAIAMTLGPTLISTGKQTIPQTLEDLPDMPAAWEFRSLLDRLKSTWSVLVFLHPRYLPVAAEVAHLFEGHLISQGIEVTNELAKRPAKRSTEAYPALPVRLRRKETRSDKRRGSSAQEVSDLEEALDFAHRLGDVRSEATAHYELGVARSQLGYFAEAVEHFEQALWLAQTLNDTEAIASYLRELGVIYMGMRRFQDAVEMFHRSMEITRQYGDKKAEARALDNLAIAYSSLRDYPRAISSLEQVIEVWRKLDQRTEMMNALRRLGREYSEIMDYASALKAYELCLAATGPSEPSEYIPTITEMSRLYARQSDFRSAEALLRQAIRLVPSCKLREWAAEVYGQLGFVLFSQDQREEATEFLERARKG